MDKHEYHERKEELSDAEKLAWLTKNWILPISCQDVIWLCKLAAKGLERASLNQSTSQEN